MLNSRRTPVACLSSSHPQHSSFPLSSLLSLSCNSLSLSPLSFSSFFFYLFPSTPIEIFLRKGLEAATRACLSSTSSSCFSCLFLFPSSLTPFASFQPLYQCNRLLVAGEVEHKALGKSATGLVFSFVFPSLSSSLTSLSLLSPTLSLISLPHLSPPPLPCLPQCAPLGRGREVEYKGLEKAPATDFVFPPSLSPPPLPPSARTS